MNNIGLIKLFILLNDDIKSIPMNLKLIPINSPASKYYIIQNQLYPPFISNKSFEGKHNS